MNDKLDLIDRAALLEIEAQRGHTTVDDIIAAPSVDAVPVVHGRWNGYDTSSYGGMDADGNVKWLPRRFYRCSECRKGSAVKSLYCPSCGAKMDLKDGDCNG